MRKAILIAVFVLFSFTLEFLLFNLAGYWAMPNLLLLLVIYFNLAFGIRYSIFTAVLAGILKDSFSASLFGLNIFTFVLCAYLTTFLKKYLHYVASKQSRLLLVFFITIIHVIIGLGLHMMLARVQLLDILKYVFIPEIVTTLLVTSFVFAQLKKCVLKLFA